MENGSPVKQAGGSGSSRPRRVAAVQARVKITTAEKDQTPPRQGKRVMKRVIVKQKTSEQVVKYMSLNGPQANVVTAKVSKKRDRGGMDSGLAVSVEEKEATCMVPEESDEAPAKKRKGETSRPPKILASWEGYEEDAPRLFPPLDVEAEKEAYKLVRMRQKQYVECQLHHKPLEEARARENRGSPARPDQKAMTEMMEKGQALYQDRPVGHLPGMYVGAWFSTRCEMKVLGLHANHQAGIDVLIAKDARNKVGKDLAPAIVVSGGYQDDTDEGGIMWYTGQGGNDRLGSKRQTKDQELTRGNLGLYNMVLEELPVRVIRGFEGPGEKGKATYYRYDGLYDVVECREEIGKDGFIVYKYRLVRQAGQPPLDEGQVKFMKDPNKGKGDRPGLLCKDISDGLEPQPINVVNTADEDRSPPPPFTYLTQCILPEGVEPLPPLPGCSCKGGVCDPSRCECAKRNWEADNNKKQFPYNAARCLLGAQNAVFECGPTCGCGPECINRASQRPGGAKLEVFKTGLMKNWGVRTLTGIPAHKYVGEYTGKILSADEVAKLRGDLGQDEYTFDLDCLQTAHSLDGRESRGICARGLDEIYGSWKQKHAGEQEDELDIVPFTIDAGHHGNFTRFINHSCAPNLFVQCVFHDHGDIRLPHIKLFAFDDIPPFTELTYDYGYGIGSVIRNGEVVVKECHCGHVTCRKRMY